MATPETLKLLRLRGDVVWENDRYNATYVIDRPELSSRLGVEIPVLHLGQPDGIEAVKNALPDVFWIVVDLYCSRLIGLERIRARGTGDSEHRISVWDQTPRLSNRDLSIDTGKTSPIKAACLIRELSSSRP
jgi:guanylate kinase